MKKLFFICSLITIHCSLFSQNWLWGKEGDAIKIMGGSTKVAADKFGNVYATGSYDAGGVSFGSYNLTSLTQDGYLVKYNSQGKVMWALNASGSQYSDSWWDDVTTDIYGNVYVSGTFNDTITIGSVSLFSTIPPGRMQGSAFLVKFDSNGNVLWARKSVATGGMAEATAVATDKYGNAYITGQFDNSETFGPYTLTPNYINCFLVKYNTNGKVVWAQQSISNDGTWPTAIAVSPLTGNVFVAGFFYGNAGDGCSFGPQTIYPSSLNGSMFAVKYDSSGNALWANCAITSTNLSFGQAEGITVDNADNAYVSGWFDDGLSFGSYYFSVSGGYGQFLAKYGNTGSLIWAKQTTGNIGSSWAGYAVAADAHNHIYLTGLGNGDTVKFSSCVLTTKTSGNLAYILKLDTAGNVICGSALHNGTWEVTWSFACGEGLAVDSSGYYTYIGGTSGGLAICGTDTIGTQGSNIYVARWQSCTSPADTTSPVDTIKAEPCNGSLFIPDAFSPNNDGKNDILYVRGDCINTMDFIVYDRWGNKVFESQNQSVGWDGTYKGESMNTGTYVWYLKAILDDGSTVVKKGNVALVR